MSPGGKAKCRKECQSSERWRIVFHLLQEKTHDKKKARKRKDLANCDGIGASVKRARPAIKTVLLPILSPSAPLIRRKLAKTRAYPSTIHWSPVTFALSCSLISTNAIFTIVTSRIVMK